MSLLALSPTQQLKSFRMPTVLSSPFINITLRELRYRQLLQAFNLASFLSPTLFFTQVEELLVAANTSFSASSSRYLLTPQDSILSGNKTWCAEFDDEMQYLEIDLKRNSYITEIFTQGAVDEEAWVDKFKVSYGHSGDVWKKYEENGRVKVMYTEL